jgi:DNA-binding protein HU-beta
MTKDELVKAIAHELGESQMTVECVINKLGKVATETLSAGEEVPLPGLGKLKVVERAARQGRNPQSGEAITIPARKAPVFSPSGALKKAVGGA